MLYLLLTEGDSPDTARPFFATCDVAVIQAVVSALRDKVGDRTPAAVRPLSTPPPTIGTTRSGKDVFHTPSYSAHWKYTAEDHEDAARIHEEAGRARQAAQHRHKARMLRASEPVPQPELLVPKTMPKNKVKAVPKRVAEPVTPPTPEPEPVPPPAAKAVAPPESNEPAAS